MNNKKLHECLDKAFDHFNQQLFKGQLKKCVLNFSRQQRALGFFAPRSWVPTEVHLNPIGSQNKEILVHEISINPDYMTVRNPDQKEAVKEIFSTLVHEMCHLWQEDHGEKLPKNKKYHNKEWANKMISVGLYPSHTGQPGGKKTGPKMSHYIIKEGLFEEAYKNLSEENKFPFLGLGKFNPRKKGLKTKGYKCTMCETKVRGELGLNIVCGKCGLSMD